MRPPAWIIPIGFALAAGSTLFGLWDGVQRLDEQLFVLLNSLGSQRWDGLWLVVSNKLSSIPLFVALMYLVYRHHGLRNMLVVVVLIILMITATDQLANLFKHTFERPRPCREEHLQAVIRYIAPRCGRYGFFSAHAANSMALAVFLGLLFRNIYRHLVMLLLAWAAIVGFSRIYLGVHYPLDTLSGMVIGGFAGFLAHELSRRIKLQSGWASSRRFHTARSPSQHPSR